MYRIVLLPMIVYTSLALENSTFTVDTKNNFCNEYADCIHQVNVRSMECWQDNSTTWHSKVACNEAVMVQTELQQLHNMKNSKVESCIRNRAPGARFLSTQKTERCISALQKTKRSPDSQQKKDKKEKIHSCGREVRKMRNQCAKIAKCCSVVKSCNTENSKKDIISKKKELKKKLQNCRNKELNHKKDKKRNRQDLGTDNKKVSKARSERKQKSENMQENGEGKGNKLEETPTKDEGDIATINGKKRI